MRDNPYLKASATIPRGETRSFLELAALAGRPGAARAAGRALSLCPTESPYPWHRVVTAGGAPRSDPARESIQWKRLRREGARPRPGESVGAWAQRVGAAWIGNYKTREYAKRSDPRIGGWSPESVERLENPASGRARGFSPAGEPRGKGEPLPAPSFIRSEDGPGKPPVPARLASVDWSSAGERLGEEGYVWIPALLSSSECASILRESTEESRFERSVEMLPRGFGFGSYHYYKEPLPPPAGDLRESLYERLAPLANELWPDADYPRSLAAFWARCRDAGQRRSSSILICYGVGGVNHPHRDIYGSVWFPFQALLMLARRKHDFDGGEFLLIDEREGAEAREIPASEGDVVVFVSRERFERNGGRRRRIGVRHGMKTVTRGKRYGLGMVLHLAE